MDPHQRACPSRGHRHDAAIGAVRERVGDDVAQRAGQVPRVRPRDRPGLDRDVDVRRSVATLPVERERDLGDRDGQIDGRRSCLERGRLGAGEVVDIGHDAAQRSGRRAGGLQTGGIGRDDAVDHRLELGFEDGGGRREVMGDVAGRATAEHLRSLEAIGHGVERVGQLGRLAIVAARRPRPRFARLEPSRGGRHVVQRACQPAGDPGRHEHDPEHAHQARHRERDVEQAQEARIARARRHVGFERRHEGAVGLDRRLVVRPVAGRGPPERSEGRPVGADDPDLAVERRGQARDERLGTGEPGRPRQAVGQRQRCVVESLLLLVGEDGLEAGAHDAIDHDPDEQQDGDDGDAEEQAEPPRQRAAPRRGRHRGRAAHAGSRLATSR